MKKHENVVRVPGLRRLTGIALGILWTGVSGMVYLRHQERKKILQSDYYKTSMALLRAFTPAVEKLGNPIIERPIDVFFNAGLSITPFTARVTVPLKGSVNSGILYSWSSRDEVNEGWRIERLDLDVKNEPERLTVFRDNSKFPRAQMLDPRLMNKPKTEADDPLAYIDTRGNVKKQPMVDDCWEDAAAETS